MALSLLALRLRCRRRQQDERRGTVVDLDDQGDLPFGVERRRAVQSDLRDRAQLGRHAALEHERQLARHVYPVGGRRPICQRRRIKEGVFQVAITRVEGLTINRRVHVVDRPRQDWAVLFLPPRVWDCR